MMILNELTLRRFRIHENLTIKLRPGVTGIVGRNGTGKSSIIEAIGFLFTGEADDPKDQVITAGQSGTSYVRGRFTLNGREGTIERALDTSRVLLEYDGQKLVKAGEVKELWARLLQIDPHIFQHVIMAKQKKIPELFSGETSVREKAFQRIFMVPNTERLRLMIWDGYIKQCPPPLPEDDLYAIEQQLSRLRYELQPKTEKLTLMSSSVLSEHQLTAVIGYTNHYNRCIQDAEKRPRLESQLATARADLEGFAAQRTEMEKALASLPPKLEEQYSLLIAKKEQYRNHLQAKAQLAQAQEALLRLSIDPEAIQVEINEFEQATNLARSRILTNEAEIKNIEQEVVALQGLDGAAVCPTCHQPLQEIEKHRAEAQNKLATLIKEQATLKERWEQQAQMLYARKTIFGQWQTYNASVQALKTQAEGSFIDYDETQLSAVMTLRQHAQETQESLRQLELAQTQTEATIRVIEEQIKHLVAYTGNSTPTEELVLMNEVLERHRMRMQEISALEKEIAQVQAEITLLEQRRAVSTINREKNRNRTEYNNKLRMAYDVLHTSQFPRKLVQTYGTVVEEELQQQLQRFDLPYQARINEDFRIVITRDGHVVPRLSGGQEMVVGLCLRLALHSMFSQAFPLLIIDEGTTHLDDENKKLYFQCIEDLKKDKVIQQLIIIDHSSLLVDAVDYVIKL